MLPEDKVGVRRKNDSSFVEAVENRVHKACPTSCQERNFVLIDLALDVGALRTFTVHVQTDSLVEPSGELFSWRGLRLEVDHRVLD